VSQAGLIDIEASHPTIPTRFDGDAGSAIPVSNVLEVQGLTVANATYVKPVFVSCSGNTAVVNVQTGSVVTGAPADSNDAGLASFDDTYFTQDANGWVSFIGPSTSQTITGDSGGALSPVAGNWNIIGTSVQGVSSSGFGDTLTFTVADATAITKGVSSYFISDFSVIGGDVSLVDSVVKSVTTDSGVLTPSSHSFSILGGVGASVTHAGTVITVDTSGGGFDWIIVTDAAATLVSGQGVFANRGTLVTLTLPAVAALGDVFRVINKGAGFVKIAQNAGDTIQFSDHVTTAGVGGSLTATAVGDALEIVAIGVNEYYVASSIGNWDYA